MRNKIFKDNKGVKHQLGPDDIAMFRPAAYTVVENSSGDILMIVNNKFDEWQFPGGGLEIGEDITDGAKREVREETGYEIKLTDQRPFHTSKDLTCSERGDKFRHCINFFFKGKIVSETLGELGVDKDEEILKVQFFSKEQLRHIPIVFWQKDILDKAA